MKERMDPKQGRKESIDMAEDVRSGMDPRRGRVTERGYTWWWLSGQVWVKTGYDGGKRWRRYI